MITPALENNGVSMQNDLSGILLNPGNFRKYWNAFSDVVDVSPQFAKDPCITLNFPNEVFLKCTVPPRLLHLLSPMPLPPTTDAGVVYQMSAWYKWYISPAYLNYPLVLVEH